jgi:TRAP-type C4-dicarboxylate transport system permease small subunit
MSDRRSSRLIDIVTNAAMVIAVVSLFAMMLLITADALLNKTIGKPIPGTLEITSYYFMVLVVFLALPYIEKTETHISADFIVARFSKRVQNLFTIAGKIFTILFYGLLAHGAISQAIKATNRLETVMSNFTFYIWPARWGVAFGIVSAIIIAALVIYQRCRDNH